MGQKVHPLGFRVGITKKHQSQWFARFNKHKYAQSVLEDLMIRKTLTNLFPNLLNPIVKKVQKRDDESSLMPKITQIKIERGLIPYEIGIQIHAENCDLIKSSIENLKPSHDLACKLQKTRHYLQYLRLNLENFQTISDSLSARAGVSLAKERTTPEAKSEARRLEGLALETPISKKKEAGHKWKKGIHLENLFKKGIYSVALRADARDAGVRDIKKKRVDNKSKSAFSKSQLRRQRLILKRLKKRQFIKLRYKLLINKGLLLTKKGNKVIQKINSQKKGFFAQKDLFFTRKQKKGNLNKNIKKSNNLIAQRALVLNLSESGATSTNTRIRNKNYVSFNIFKSRIKKKFVSIFVNRMNKKFLQVLKISLIEASKRLLTGNSNKATSDALLAPTVLACAIERSAMPLGWSKKWDFNVVKKGLGLKSLKVLTKLISVLEQKLLNKMESLRNEFFMFGFITKASSLRYYQMLTFLKQLKEYVSQIKRKQKFQKHFNKLNREGSSSHNARRAVGTNSSILSVREALGRQTALQNINNKVDTHTVMYYVLSKKLNNIENECRKMKFIEYLKQVIKKHRSDNIYYYLTTIAEARQDLRKLKKFIQNHASFLFGLNLTNNITNVESSNTKSSGILKERLQNVLAKNSVKLELEKTLQDIFLEQIDKQRNMYIENAQLIPKIAIKFYAVNTKSLKAKASIVASSVVDALEKRKAFRKVIKDAKEELMRTQGVKGVKIQVSGRLNGAEIARSEWVRAGRVPLQTLRANLDYSYKTANTIYGIIGVKVWIFKGYIKLI